MKMGQATKKKEGKSTDSLPKQATIQEKGFSFVKSQHSEIVFVVYRDSGKTF